MRIDGDLAQMISLICSVRDVSSPELLGPIVRNPIMEMYWDLYPLIRKMKEHQDQLALATNRELGPKLPDEAMQKEDGSVVWLSSTVPETAGEMAIRDASRKPIKDAMNLLRPNSQPTIWDGIDLTQSPSAQPPQAGQKSIPDSTVPPTAGSRPPQENPVAEKVLNRARQQAKHAKTSKKKKK